MLAGIVLGLALATSPATQPPATSLTVERQLQRQIWMQPGDHVALARLAALYARPARPAKARRLYRALQRAEDVELERSSGTPVRSRALATAALARLETARTERLASR